VGGWGGGGVGVAEAEGGEGLARTMEPDDDRWCLVETVATVVESAPLSASMMAIRSPDTSCGNGSVSGMLMTLDDGVVLSGISSASGSTVAAADTAGTAEDDLETFRRKFRC